MKGPFHVLNGDALLEKFPTVIAGTRIVARECLVDGPVTTSSLKALFELRAQFLSESYKVCTPKEYQRDSASQFKQLLQIPPEAEIHLWFEDDLFCQVNKWFVLYLLQNRHDCSIYEVRPDKRSPYGFSTYTTAALEKLYAAKKPIPLPSILCELWPAYVNAATDQLQSLAQSLDAEHEPVKKAIKAHLDRLPKDGNLGLPQETLKGIIAELDTDAFGPVFQAFQQRLPFYGFGDLQVKRMWEALQKDS